MNLLGGNRLVLRLKTQMMVAYAMVANLTVATAGAPVVGVAVKSGSFTVDGARVSGNATVFEGNRIDTGSGSTRLELNNGNRLSLGADSAGSIYRNRFVLEKGAGDVVATNSFQVEALNLFVTPGAAKASARVSLPSPGLLHVDAVNGAVEVATKKGVLLARLDPGTSLDFTPPPDGATAPARVSGTIHKVGDRFVLQEETSKVTIELRGSDLSTYTGARVEIEGIVLNEASSVPNTSEVIKVAKVTKIGKSGATARGHHGPTTVIAGVGVAAAATGAGFVISRGSDTKAVSPSSR